MVGQSALLCARLGGDAFNPELTFEATEQPFGSRRNLARESGDGPLAAASATPLRDVALRGQPRTHVRGYGTAFRLTA